MQNLRVRLRMRSSFATPLQADTIFGHFCWAVAYLEGIESLQALLEAYDGEPPFLVSDGFPAVQIEGREDWFYYLPRPAITFRSGDYDSLEQDFAAGESKMDTRQLHTAIKGLDKLQWIEESVFRSLRDNLTWLELTKSFLTLEVCPKACVPRRLIACECKSWKECPGLETGSKQSKNCPAVAPSLHSSPVAHNVLNRWTSASENIFIQDEMFPEFEFHFLVKLDERIVDESRLRGWLDYVTATGYGRDSSTGKGAIEKYEITGFNWPEDGANAFLNLSSAYVPRAGQLGPGCYQVHTKRGKLGDVYAVSNSPWKKPILMIKSGAVFQGEPSQAYGCLVKNVHYELPDVVQYGYAYPLGVNADV